MKRFNLLEKIFSGRYVLTLAGSICFCAFSYIVCRLLLDKSEMLKISDISSIMATLMIVISNIVTFYFIKGNLRNEGTIEDDRQKPQ